MSDESLKYPPIGVKNQQEKDRQIQRLVELLNDGAVEDQSVNKLLDIIPCGVSLTFDLSCEEIRHNPAMAKFLRIEDWDSLSFSAKVIPSFKVLKTGVELAAEELPIQRAVWRGQAIAQEEYEFVWNDGISKFTMISARPLRDRDGIIIGAIATSHDITEHKAEEEARYDEKLKDYVDSMEVIHKQLSFSEVCIRGISHSVADTKQDFLDKVIDFIRQEISCHFVGIRVLAESGCMAYESCTELSSEFVPSQNKSSVSPDNCICAKVIRGRPLPHELMLCSVEGSFCCNDLQAFASACLEDEPNLYQGTCIQSEYQSLAIIPVRFGSISSSIFVCITNRI